MQTAHQHFICPVNNANQSASNTKTRTVAIRKTNNPHLSCPVNCTDAQCNHLPVHLNQHKGFHSALIPRARNSPPVHSSKSTKTSSRPVELSLPLVQWTSNCYTNVNSFKTPQNDTLGSCGCTVFVRLKRIVVNKLLGIIQ